MKKSRRIKRSSRAASSGSKPGLPKLIADLAGSVDGLPADLSERKKYYLRKGYGRHRPR
jgi:hypothetical protein